MDTLLTTFKRDPLALAVAYLLALIGLTVGLVADRASGRRMLTGPLMAVPLALFGAEVAAALSASTTIGLWPLFRAIGPGLAGISGFLLARRRARAVRPDTLIRGTAVVDARRACLHWAARRSRRSALRFAGQYVPAADEMKHFKVLGTTGTGKTTAIRGLLAGALDRGDRAVVADPDGAYIREFFDDARGDAILNPFDARSSQWNLFGECSLPADGDHLARSLIADHAGEERNWRGYARVFVAALLRQLHRAGHRDVASLYRLLVYAPADELAVLLSETAAAPYLAPENARFFASVRAIAISHCAILEHFQSAADGRALSVRAWVRGVGRKSRVLFLPYRANEVATLRGAISAWIRLAIFETMALGEADHRLWLVVDELDALGAVDGLRDALARLRKFGGRCVLGFQSIAQVGGTYGRYDAQTIVENCGNTLILRCSSSANDGTAQFASRLIGEREVLRDHVTRSRRGIFAKAGGTSTATRQHVTEHAVLAAEIEQLADFAGYLKFASKPEWRRVHLAD